MRKCYYKDKEVQQWATLYVADGCTLLDLENSLGIQHSTIWWCFTHRLRDIDSDLYHKVLSQFEHNKANKRRPIREDGSDGMGKHTCCICGKTFVGWGNNPYPVDTRDKATCCDECSNSTVLEARLRRSLV